MKEALGNPNREAANFNFVDFSWKKLKNSSSLETRERFTCTIFKENVYIYGGLSKGKHRNDMEQCKYSNL